MSRKRKGKTIPGQRVDLDFLEKVRAKAKSQGIFMQDVYRNLAEGGTL